MFPHGAAENGGELIRRGEFGEEEVA